MTAALSPGERLRKAGHLGAGLGALLVAPLGPGPVLGLVLAALIFNALVLPRWLGRRLRRPGEGMISWGPTYYCVAVAILLVVHWPRPHVAAAGWALMAVGDTAATVIGRHRGRRKLPWHRDKSWAGSAAYWIAGSAAAFGLLFASAGAPAAASFSLPTLVPALIALSLAAALVAAIIESLPLPVDDNLLPPVLGSFVLWGLVEAGARAPDLLAIEALRRVPIAGLAHLVLAWLAWRLAAVTRGGAIVGGVLGTLFVWTVGWTGWSMLAALVGLAFGATAVGAGTKRSRGTLEARRHAGQVLAKGGVAAVAAALAGAGASPLWLAAAAGALAAAAADTVASEIGVLGRGRPRLLPGLRRVPVGTPGAVSPLGTVAAVFAACVPGFVGLLVGAITVATATVAALAGFAATLLESLLAGRRAAGARTDPVMMNFLTTLVAALAAAALTSVVT